jgi:hypothetical protein
MIINSLGHRSVKTQATSDLLIGRSILDVTYNATSYGMGGNGFFGLHLDKRGRRKDEWLLLTIFAADNWLSVDGRWLAANPSQYQQQRPLHGAGWIQDEAGLYVPTGEQWDEFKPLVLRKTITSFSCTRTACQLVIETTTLEIREDPTSRPLFEGNGKLRAFASDDDLRNAWVLAKNPYFLI